VEGTGRYGSEHGSSFLATFCHCNIPQRGLETPNSQKNHSAQKQPQTLIIFTPTREVLWEKLSTVGAGITVSSPEVRQGPEYISSMQQKLHQEVSSLVNLSFSSFLPEIWCFPTAFGRG